LAESAVTATAARRSLGAAVWRGSSLELQPALVRPHIAGPTGG